MKRTINQIKVSEISDVIQRMDIDRDMIINITIETMEDDFLTVFDRIGKEAQDKGLTEEILAGLLADES
jgi:hypothetical protein